MAPALVLQHDAQDVWQGSDSGKDADARAGDGLGKYRDGGGVGPQTSRLAQIYSVGEGAYRGARWMSVLSGHQFCRWQKRGIE